MLEQLEGLSVTCTTSALSKDRLKFCKWSEDHVKGLAVHGQGLQVEKKLFESDAILVIRNREQTLLP